MKVLLYFEGENSIKQSGIGRALKHQIKALTSVGIEYTLNPKDDFDIAHINTYFIKSKRLLRKLKARHVPVIVHGHSTLEDFRDSFRYWKLVYHLWYKPNLLWFYRHADLIITPTEYSKTLIENYRLNTNVVAISNGVDIDEYQPDKSKVDQFKKYFHINDEKVVIGVGWLFNRKGIKDFFAIAKKKPNVKFIWFGSLKRILTQSNVLRAIKHRPNNVIMPGYVSGDIIKGAYQYASCLLFPSYEETEGIVVLEALASKCPLLIRDIPIYDKWLTDGENCFKAKNNDEFINRIDYILSHNINKVKENGYLVTVAKKIDKIGTKLKNAYINLTANK